MYSANNEISTRQVFWLVLCEKIGISLLVVPFIMIWCYSVVASKLGIVASALIGAFLGVVIFLICMGVSRLSSRISLDNKYIKVFECVKMAAIFVAVMVIYSDLTKTLFLDRMSSLIIIALTAGLVFYLTSGNIENIARGTQALAGFIIIPVVVMIVSSIPLVDSRLLSSGLNNGAFANLKEVILNIALAFLCITPMGKIGQTIKREENTEARDETNKDILEHKCKRRASEKALLVVLILTIIVYMLILMVVGVGGLRGKEYPLISLMRVSSIPGSFKGDVQGVAALSLFIVISLVYEITDAFFFIRRSINKGRVNVVAIMVLVIVSTIFAKKDINVFENFFSGFKHYQIEDRQYCMSIAVDLDGKGLVYTYEFRNVDGTLTTTALTNKEQDFTRVCAIVISRSVKENGEAFKRFIKNIKNNDQIGNNALILFCEGEALTMIKPPNQDEEEVGGSMGEYIAGTLRGENYNYDVSRLLADFKED